MAAVDEANRARAREFLRAREAKGGTILQSALPIAYKYANPDRTLNAIVLSDGMTETQSRDQLFAAVAGRPANTRVFCIGVGNDVDASLLTRLAQNAGGLAAFVSRGDDFDRQAQSFRRKLLHPVATDLALEIQGLETYDLEPEKIPNLFHGMPERIYGRYRNGGSVQVVVRATVNGRAIETVGKMEFPKSDLDNPEIERMWAWHRMQRLQGELDAGAQPRDPIIAEIVRLGEGFSIASEYTSFLVLENNEEYKRWKIERRNVLRMDRDRAAQQKTRAAIETMRKQAFENLGPKAPVEVVDKPAASSPASNSAPAPVAQAPAVPPVRVSNSRGFDAPNFGGGAIDPVTGLVVFGISATAAALRARRRKG